MKIGYKTIEWRRSTIWLLVNWFNDFFLTSQGLGVPKSENPFRLTSGAGRECNQRVTVFFASKPDNPFLALPGKPWQGESLCSGHSTKTAFQSKKVIDN